MRRRLYKSNDGMIFGVCSGIGDFFNIDPVVIRLLMVILAVCSFGTGVVVYLVAAIIIPNRPYADDDRYWESRNWRNANERGSRWADEGDRGRWDNQQRDAGNQHCDSTRRRSDEDFDQYFNKK